MEGCGGRHTARLGCVGRECSSASDPAAVGGARGLRDEPELRARAQTALRRRRGAPPRQADRGLAIVVGDGGFAGKETLAYLYAEARRAGGYRVAVRGGGGLRKEAAAALRAGRISLYPAYSGSLLEYLGGTSLRRALARLHAE